MVSTFSSSLASSKLPDSPRPSRKRRKPEQEALTSKMKRLSFKNLFVLAAASMPARAACEGAKWPPAGVTVLNESSPAFGAATSRWNAYGSPSFDEAVIPTTAAQVAAIVSPFTELGTPRDSNGMVLRMTQDAGLITRDAGQISRVSRHPLPCYGWAPRLRHHLVCAQ